MRIVIIGGLGFIGRRLAGHMAERGHDLLLIDLPRFGPLDPGGVLRPSTEVAFHDVLEVDDWIGRLRDADVVVHAAAVHQVDEIRNNPIRALEVNVGATRLVLEAAATADVSRVVYLSSAKVYGRTDGSPSRESDLVQPAEQYGVAKVVGEGYCSHFCENTALEVVTLRPFSVYGPHQPTNTGYIGALLASLRASNRVVLPGRPSFTRDFVHIDVVVRACAAAIEATGTLPAVLNVGSGLPTSLSDLVELFELVTGRGLEVTFVEPRPGTLTDTLGDTTLLDEFTSTEPVALSDGLVETVAAQIGAT